MACVVRAARATTEKCCTWFLSAPSEDDEA